MHPRNGSPPSLPRTWRWTYPEVRLPRESDVDKSTAAGVAVGAATTALGWASSLSQLPTVQSDTNMLGDYSSSRSEQRASEAINDATRDQDR